MAFGERAPRSSLNRRKVEHVWMVCHTGCHDSWGCFTQGRWNTRHAVIQGEPVFYTHHHHGSKLSEMRLRLHLRKIALAACSIHTTIMPANKFNFVCWHFIASTCTWKHHKAWKQACNDIIAEQELAVALFQLSMQLWQAQTCNDQALSKTQSILHTIVYCDLLTSGLENFSAS